MADTWADDIRYALRGIRRRVWISAAVIATTAIGIASAAAVLSVVDGVLVRQVPYPSADRIAWLNVWNVKTSTLNGMANPYDVRDWRARSHSFAAIAPYASSQATLELSAAPVRVDQKYVGIGMDQVLGIRAAAGRMFNQEDYEPGVYRIILSNALWKEQFGSDPAIAGRTINVNGTKHTIIGVLPPTTLSFPGEQVGIWSVLREPTDDAGMKRSGVWLRVVGRLRDGVTLEAAQAEMSAIAASLQASSPATNDGREVSVVTLRDGLTSSTRPIIILLGIAVVIVLLIASANIGSLLLASAHDRRREFAVRAALGAGMSNVVRMVLIESAALGITGGIIGLVLAPILLTSLINLYPAGLPRAAEIHISPAVITAALIAIGGAILAGGMPALLQMRRLDLQQTLRSGERGLTAVAQRRVRGMLVVMQIALSVALLAGGGILMRTFLALAHTDPGFAPAQLLSFNISVPSGRYPAMAQEVALYDALLERIRSMPGVHAAGASSLLPMSKGDFIDGFHRDGYVDELPNLPEARLQNITPGYLEALGVPVIKGRTFSAADRSDAPAVAVVSQALEKQYFPNGAIGKRFRLHDQQMEIVGVVGDKHHADLRENSYPDLYVARAQTDNPRYGAWFVIRGDNSVASLVGPIRAALKEIDGGIALADVSTMETRLQNTLAPDRFRATLIGALALIALCLATLGLYSLIAYAVAQQTREIGIRMALGATSQRTIGGVLRNTLVLAAAGIAIGLAVALVGSRLLQGFVVGISPRDPLTFTIVPLFFFAVAALAAAAPARRASRVNPVTALRAD